MQKSTIRNTRICLVAMVLLCATAPPSSALITGTHGNHPVQNMGWPTGSERFANLPSRLGYWEGPPFGGGQYHFLYRCEDTAQFNRALEVFSEIRAPALKLIVHDGPGRSFWLDAEHRDPPDGDARVDWTFDVCKPASWHFLYSNPKSVYGSDSDDFRKPVPPPTIRVYIGGGGPIVWGDVRIPDNIEVIDKRAEAAPVKPVGGGLIQGDVYDMSTGQVIAGAEVVLLKHDGGRDWNETERTETDEHGAFNVEKIPSGRHKIRVRAEGYASRFCGSYEIKGNTYHKIVTELAGANSASGIVTDTEGKPIPGVIVVARATMGIDGRGYSPADVESVTTGADGRFEITGLPKGFTMIHCRSGTLHQATPVFDLYELPDRYGDPSGDIRIVMEGTGVVRVKVIDEHGNPPADGAHVSIEPTQGNQPGSWGGSATCEADGTYTFKRVPPGDYIVGTNPRHAGLANDPGAKTVTVETGRTIDVEIIRPKR